MDAFKIGILFLVNFKERKSTAKTLQKIVLSNVYLNQAGSPFCLHPTVCEITIFFKNVQGRIDKIVLFFSQIMKYVIILCKVAKNLISIKIEQLVSSGLINCEKRESFQSNVKEDGYFSIKRGF